MSTENQIREDVVCPRVPWRNYIEDNEPESAKQLRQEMRRGRVIVVVGAGVSRFSTGTPGWHGVVESAIDFAQEAGIASTQTVCNLRECLQASTTPSDLVDSTHAVREILIGSSSGSGAFSLWLTKYFDIPASSAQNTTLLRAILQLPSALVATTNYDKLLSLHKPGSEAVTWRQPGEVTYSLRTGQNIVHLHGAWNDPESEIFGAEDYGRIVEDEAYRSFLKTIWTAYTILFIGCSFDGMRDPDFIALLDWAAATFPNAQYTHFALVKSDNFSPEETERFLNKWKVQLVPYGADYADLVPFLESLTRPENIPVPIPPSNFVGRDSELNTVVSAIEKKHRVLIHGMGGIGKSAFAARVVSEIQSRESRTSVMWIDNQEKSLPVLYAELAERLPIPAAAGTTDTELGREISNQLSKLESAAIFIDVDNEMGEIANFVRQCIPNNVALTIIARTRAIGFQTSIEIGALPNLSAIALFSGTSGTSIDDPLVAEICSILEGHPLAIILAASRHAVEALPLASIRDRLASETHRIDTLHDPEQTTGTNSSVRASIAVSLDGLTDELMQVLVTLAFFPADTSTGLLAIALELDIIECEDRIGRLVSRSLLQRNQHGFLHMHMLIRAAVKEIAGKESDKYQNLVDGAIVHILMSLNESSIESQSLLVNNMDNIAAFIISTTYDHSAERQVAAIGLSIVLFEPHGLVSSYSIHSCHSYKQLRIHEVLAAALRMSGYIGDTSLTVQLLICQASVRSQDRNPTESLTVLKRALVLAEEKDDFELLASVKCQFGNTFVELNDYPKAEGAFRSGLEDARNSNSLSSKAQLTGQLGHLLLLSGKLEESKCLYDEALQYYTELAYFRGVAACTANLAGIAERLGDITEAWKQHIASLEAEILANNHDGALASMESLAARATDETKLRFVLGRIEALVATLPVATLQAHAGIEESMKASAYISMKQWDDAEKLLLLALDDRRGEDDLRG